MGVSHRFANLLVGNQPDCATLEVTLVGPTLEFLAETAFAVAGAEFELWLDAEPAPANASCHAGRGSRLRFGRRGGGARAYLAVAGGIDVPPVLGSRSTDLASGLGGLGGRPLCGGDELRVGQWAGLRVPRLPPAVPITLPRGGATVRVIPGPDEDRFAARAIELFGQARFTLEPESNRMGVPIAWAVARAGPTGAAVVERYAGRHPPGAPVRSADSSDGRPADHRWVCQDRNGDQRRSVGGRAARAR